MTTTTSWRPSLKGIWERIEVRPGEEWFLQSAGDSFIPVTPVRNTHHGLTIQGPVSHTGYNPVVDAPGSWILRMSSTRITGGRSFVRGLYWCLCLSTAGYRVWEGFPMVGRAAIARTGTAQQHGPMESACVQSSRVRPHRNQNGCSQAYSCAVGLRARTTWFKGRRVCPVIRHCVPKIQHGYVLFSFG